MFILRRKVGQAIVIDGDIILRVLRIGDTNVELGFESPDDVDILREEVA